MLEQFYNACRRFEDRPAFFIAGTYYTYAELAQHVQKIMSVLVQSIAGSKSNIGIVTYDDIETYASIISIMSLGCTFVPINPAFPDSRNKAIIYEAGIMTIVSSHEETVFSKSDLIQLIETKNINAVNDLTRPVTVDPSDNAYLLFTSGSTGVPKGVPISHGNISAFIEAFFDCTPDLNENDRVLQMFDLTFDFSIATYLAPLTKGACVCTLSKSKLKILQLCSFLNAADISIAPMVPSVLNFLRPYFEEIHLPKLRHSYFCGEALYADIIEEWKKCVPNAIIQNFYGPTEATVFSTVYNCDDKYKELNGVISIGKPMKNMDAIIVDENKNPVAPGEKGELCLTGRQVSAGYWKNPQQNLSSFVDICVSGCLERFYRTGDLAICDENGDLYFCGRMDSQVQIQGYRVELGDIECQAREIAPKSNLCAVAFINKFGNDEIQLFVEGQLDKIKEIHAFLKQKLPSYMNPSMVRSIGSLPLNQNGKISREQLIQYAKSGSCND
jgi:D-alanine--poly(phosphoribitol) ligase subunit 1